MTPLTDPENSVFNSTSRDRHDPSMPLEHGDLYEIVYLPDRTLVRFNGEVDMAVSGLNAVADEAIGTGKPVVVDVAAVTFMDSVGCGFLARLIVGTKPHRVRVVGGAGEQVARLLRRMGMHLYLDLLGAEPVAESAPPTDVGTGGTAAVGGGAADALSQNDDGLR